MPARGRRPVRSAPMWAHKLTAPPASSRWRWTRPILTRCAPGEVLARFLAGAICGSDLPGFLGRPQPGAARRPTAGPATPCTSSSARWWPPGPTTCPWARAWWAGPSACTGGLAELFAVPRGLGARARRRPAVDPGDGGPTSSARSSTRFDRVSLVEGRAGRRDRPGAPRPAVQPRPQGPRRLPRDGRGRDRPARCPPRGLRRGEVESGSKSAELGRHARPRPASRRGDRGGRPPGGPRSPTRWRPWSFGGRVFAFGVPDDQPPYPIPFVSLLPQEPHPHERGGARPAALARGVARVPGGPSRPRPSAYITHTVPVGRGPARPSSWP